MRMFVANTRRARPPGKLLLLAVFLFASVTEPVHAHTAVATHSSSRCESLLLDETERQLEAAYPAIFAFHDQSSIGFVAHDDPVNRIDPTGHLVGMMGQSAEDIVQVGVGLDPQPFARDHEGEEIGRRLAAGFLTDVQPIAPSEHDAAQTVFDRVMPTAGLCRAAEVICGFSA